MFSNMNGSNSWTISFWVKLKENPGFIMWKGNYFASDYLTVSTDSTGDISIWGADGGVTTINTKWPTDLALNTWYQVTITSVGTGTNRANSCYINGVAYTASANTTVLSSQDLESHTGSELVKFGALHTLAYYEMYLDHVASWSVAISAASAAAIYTYHGYTANLGNYIDSNRLLLWYPFDDGQQNLSSPTVSANSAGTGNFNTTLVNTQSGVWASSNPAW
jgi:hypothetical protein